MPQDFRGNFIDNQWTIPADPTREMIRENPAAPDETVMRLVWSESAVDHAVAAARRAQPDWDRRGLSERLEFLHRFRAILVERKEELARAISLEMGKPLWEARGEAGALVSKIDIMTDEGLNPVADVHPDGLDGGGWKHRPLGVLAVLGPYNFPLHLPNGHIIPALATGNTVVVKPSEVTPLSMQLYFQCLREAGIPDGVVNLVQGPGPVGARLSTHRDVNGVLFTGSYNTGKRIQQATIDQPGKLLALEMGGKNTTVVCGDADIDQAATAIVESACLTTGQRCSATSRVVVDAAVADALTQRLTALLKRTTSGDPFDEDDEPLMGPLATKSGFQDFLNAQRDDEDGCLLPILDGGADPDHPDGYFVRPSLWRASRVDKDGTHQANELFGPDIVLYEVEDDDEAVSVANATDYGLAMSVFTADEERFDHMSYDLRCGILNLNRSTVGASSRLPFGGVKKSGNHRPAAVLAANYCTYPVASLRNDAGFDQDSAFDGPLSRLSSQDE